MNTDNSTCIGRLASGLHRAIGLVRSGDKFEGKIFEGQINQLDPSRKFGYIKVFDSEYSYFLHIDDCAAPSLLRVGAQLKFNVSHDPRTGKPRAVNAKKLFDTPTV